MDESMTPEAEVSTEPEMENEDIKQQEVDTDVDSDESLEAMKESLKKDKPAEPKDAEPDTEISINDRYKKQLENGIDIKEPILVKANGQVLEITDSKDVQELINKGLDYTAKTQELAQFRDVLSTLENYGITDSQTLQRVLNGEQEIQQPQQQYQEPQQINQVNQVAEYILQSDKADEVKTMIGSLPPQAQQVLSSDANILNGFYQDVANGVAQKIIPEATKLMAIRGLSFIDAYMTAGQSVMNQDNSKQVLNNEPTTKGKPAKRQLTRDDIFNMSEEDFEKWGAKLKRQRN